MSLKELFVTAISEMDTRAVAKDSYEEEYQVIVKLLGDITKKVKKHKANFDKDDKDWGYVGDLESVKTKLQEIEKGLK